MSGRPYSLCLRVRDTDGSRPPRPFHLTLRVASATASWAQPALTPPPSCSGAACTLSSTWGCVTLEKVPLHCSVPSLHGANNSSHLRGLMWDWASLE